MLAVSLRPFLFRLQRLFTIFKHRFACTRSRNRSHDRFPLWRSGERQFSLHRNGDTS